jgi:hypothetical protein
MKAIGDVKILKRQAKKPWFVQEGIPVTDFFTATNSKMEELIHESEKAKQAYRQACKAENHYREMLEEDITEALAYFSERRSKLLYKVQRLSKRIACYVDWQETVAGELPGVHLSTKEAVGVHIEKLKERLEGYTKQLRTVNNVYVYLSNLKFKYTRSCYCQFPVCSLLILSRLFGHRERHSELGEEFHSRHLGPRGHRQCPLRASRGIYHGEVGD